MWRLQRARPWRQWTLVVKVSEDEVEGLFCRAAIRRQIGFHLGNKHKLHSFACCSVIYQTWRDLRPHEMIVLDGLFSVNRNGVKHEDGDAEGGHRDLP